MREAVQVGVGGENWTLSPRELEEMKKKASWESPGLEIYQAYGERWNEKNGRCLMYPGAHEK